ncbi:MAG TPA: peptide chain release factor N(5)-glutamine methyltransferase [Eubacterium sp.]|nr:peptide chain release factor N(5)-glutamine methyltransferase [Eubacterium sp.]HAX59482.1 peptide chain release factor N(5)-glutamine methyltransferase [Eubacterium sp.]HAZ86847.1 peptide chain release factor N(5)-glutamine methyltransferase [Eubacterium sp.]
MQLRAAGITEADTDAWLLFSACMGLNRTEYLMRSDAVVPDDKAEEYLGKLKRRAGREPVQYIEETAPFMGFDFYVNENVLIPRMDTEILVSEAIKRARIMFSQRQHDVNFRILDMCTGSGCIAQSTYLLLKNEGCTVEVDAVDISEKALEVARINASRLGAQVKLIRGNLFENVDNKYSMILSNPPYIRTDVIADLEPEVREHEPMLALDGTADGLYFYREITDKAWEYLENNGILMYEIGYDQALEVSDMLRQKGYTDIAVIKDFAGLDRVVAAKRP